MSSEASASPTYQFGTPLHLAIPVTSRPVLSHLFSTYLPKFPSWLTTPSHPTLSTPLHLAARLNMPDILDELMKCPGADETVGDAQGRWPEEVGTHAAVAVLRAHRHHHSRLLTSTLHRYALSGNTPGIISLFSGNRARNYVERGWVDVNAVVEGTKDATVLHLAAKRDDLSLVEWALASGADPGVQDRKRRRPGDVVPKGGRCKKVLPATPDKPLAQSLLPTGLISLATRPSSTSTSTSTSQSHAPSSTSPSSSQHPQTTSPSVSASLANASAISGADGPAAASIRLSQSQRSSSTAGPAPPHLNNLPAALFTTSAVFDAAKGPELKGMLQKYTNVAQGYRSRYFVVERGVLSYYWGEEEYPVNCRGSVELASTDIGMDTGGDRCKFWCVVKGKSGASGGYYLRARSEVEAKKWVWTRKYSVSAHAMGLCALAHSPRTKPSVVMQAKRWSLDTLTPPRTSYDGAPSRGSLTGGHGHQRAVSGSGGSGVPGAQNDWDANEELELERELERAERASEQAALAQAGQGGEIGVVVSLVDERTVSTGSMPSGEERDADETLSTGGAVAGLDTDGTSPNGSPVASSRELQIPPSRHLGAVRVASQTTVFGSDPLDKLPGRQFSAHPDDYATLLAGFNLRLDVHSKLIESVMERVPEQWRTEFEEMAEESLRSLRGVAGTVVRKAEEREKVWRKKWKTERDNRKRWEEVVSGIVGGMVGDEGPHANDIGSAAHLGAAIVNGTEAASSSRLSGPMATSLLNVNVRTDLDAQSLNSDEEAEQVVAMDGSDNEDEFFDAVDDSGTRAGRGSVSLVDQGISKLGGTDLVRKQSTRRNLAPSTLSGTTAPSEHAPSSVTATEPVESKVVPVTPEESPLSLPFVAEHELLSCAQGYPEVYRKTLPLDPTKPKPTLSVWSFIKSAIGKDLTKVTLPVFFNEPLSLLQRLSEDLEYTQLLAVAGRIGRRAGCASRTTNRDPNDPAEKMASFLGLDMAALERLDGEEAQMLRVMLVAGFGMSSYSSTVQRVGKPFNPMLGETFEVVRKDLG
ncbi:hypothetical protein HDU93_007309 [Gonapodya sp. JEL0774]|nr:hypothetical protein HDU93_007309 [Gonapodya sp. JEL0774]